MEEKKDKEKEQKRLEEQQKKLLEEQTRQLAQKVKKLPYESKCNPRGEDYLLIQQLALAGGLYLAAKEEAPEVVNAWIPIFERIISKETLDKLMKLKQEAERQDRHMQRLYKRRKIANSKGKIESNWSSLMEKSALD